jgi:uncharacterized membrane protein YvbJ
MYFLNDLEMVPVASIIIIIIIIIIKIKLSNYCPGQALRSLRSWVSQNF